MLLTETVSRFEIDHQDSRSKTTMANYRSVVRALVDFGIADSRELTRPRLAEWLTRQREKSLATATINTQLASVLSLASYLERLGRFPLKRLRQIRRLRIRGGGSLPPPCFLTRDELARLHVAALTVSEGLPLAIMLAVFAGLRLGEIQRLHREHLTITAEEEKPYVFVARDGHGRQRTRTTPIARAFAAHLRQACPASGPIFTALNGNAHGDYMSKNTLKAWLREARDRAELYHVTWFVLRHCFASYLRQGGVELSKLSGWMGNTVRVCEAHYAALAPGGDEQAERIVPESCSKIA